MPHRKIQLAIFVLVPLGAVQSSTQNAPGGPGAMPTWTAGSKEAVGTATAAESHVWFTLEGGILTEVYYPRLDTANLRTLEFAVSDGKTTWAEAKDLKHELERLNNDALLYRQTSSEPGGKFKIEKTYVSDPQRDAVLIEVMFTAPGRICVWAGNGQRDAAGVEHGAIPAAGSLRGRKENCGNAEYRGGPLPEGSPVIQRQF